VTISVAGIVATLLAAIAASLITGHQQGEQQDKNVAAQATLQDKNLSAQTAAADRKELRAVVDDAETQLGLAETALNGFRYRRQVGIATGHDLVVTANRLSASGGPEARLTIRLGSEHPITRAYVTASNALVALLACARGRAILVAPERFDPLDKLFERARGYFDDSATRLLGARLGTTKPHAAPSAPDIESVASELDAWAHQPQPGCHHVSFG
jgi:hypothetical protein